MARNAEKANAMLNRFLSAKKGSGSGEAERRPFRAADVTDVATAEKWRNAVIRDISKLIMEIQNASLGEHKVRDMNDSINKLLREKKYWEAQIKVLGGPDYTTQQAQRITDSDGRGALGSSGYFYFGAAKDLPGVRELFEKSQAEAVKRQRGELYHSIDADYYGYRDEDDGLLEKLEKKQQEKLIAASIASWNVAHANDASSSMDTDSSESTSSHLKAHVELPSQEEIERAILEKKKAEIMAKYAAM